MSFKYSEVAKDIAQKIRNGQYAPQSKLPTTDMLCSAYDVSRITIRKAMDVLSDQGLIIKRRGSGTYVKDVDPTDSAGISQIVESYSESAKTQGGEVETQMLTFEIVEATDKVAHRLRVPVGTQVYHIERIRSVNNSQGAVTYTWIPVSIVPNLTRAQAQISIYHHIEVGLGLTVSSTHRSIRAVMPTLNERIWLSLPKETPLLEIDQVTFLSDGRLFEYSILHRDTRDWSFRCVDTHTS
ncbi:GntR family transcriptional regulator [Leptogranulimonas caecicola]|uniref:GntR family transcriptional regulator n=1 Tax=Leptogranulimonas caecicola TaxID=2894156 RepID=UPI001BEFDCC8|nr:GntR family transcriptional regulator [Atopobiaceae bacterium P1]